MKENKMSNKSPDTPEAMIREMYQVIVGLPGNPKDNGMIGDVEEILEHLKILNGQVARNTTFRKIGTWVSGATVIALFGMLANLINGRW